MAIVAVVGLQWGDEGKGKIIDLLTPQVELVIRCQGGANAGHTVVVGEERYVFHQIPSGILHAHTRCILGAGTVIDPEALVEEIAQLQARGVPLHERLFISPKAHLSLPYHRLLDQGREAWRGEQRIGTTGRGIGPTYADKATRCGLRVHHLLHPEQFRTAVTPVLAEKNFLLEHFFHLPPVDLEALCRAYAAYGETLRPFVRDTDSLVRDALQRGAHVLLEGAQGTLLDLDHGTYPYVTSSNTCASGLCSGAGIAPTRLTHVLGVLKAYTTRVGMGPFPTELHDATGALLRERGQEYGATTGRSRRCGWFDAVSVRYSVWHNGVTSLALTKLDVLDPLPRVALCTAYRYKGTLLRELPGDTAVLAKVEPVYEELPGWQHSTRGLTDYTAFPAAAQRYIERIAELVECDIAIVSTGDSRTETVVRRPLF
ncbi:MAG: adenylosuccinate synthetase [Candidatus Tectimicrobiota bacterium]|nr:MAG: adenylosuccinate synthetase [Candidatus Tectomicrobia bacterium]